MFELIFGGFWTLFTAFMTFAFYGGFGGGTISVNGVPVSQAEFNAMLWPKLFFAIFWIVGLSMLFKGLKKLFANVATSSLGEETIGYVADIIDSGCYVNGNPVWNAKITFIDNTNKIKTVTESIGMNYDKYPLGTYVTIKYHKDDINILEEAMEHEAPIRLREYVGERYQDKVIENNVTAAEEEVYIDGVRYVKASPRKIENNYENLESSNYKDNSKKFDV